MMRCAPRFSLPCWAALTGYFASPRRGDRGLGAYGLGTQELRTAARVGRCRGGALKLEAGPVNMRAGTPTRPPRFAVRRTSILWRPTSDPSPGKPLTPPLQIERYQPAKPRRVPCGPGDGALRLQTAGLAYASGIRRKPDGPRKTNRSSPPASFGRKLLVYDMC
jgi:hypothetical protein